MVTAVGVPAKVVGRSREENPKAVCKELDFALRNVKPLASSRDLITTDKESQESDSDNIVRTFDSLWRDIDINRDGYLTPDELVQKLLDMGVTREQADSVYFTLDKDLDGVVSEEEFREGWSDALKSICPTNSLCCEVAAS